MSSLVSRLVTGDLLATGYATHSGIEEAAQTIAADRWRTLKPDISTSHATAPGVVISGVLVFAKGRAAPKVQTHRRRRPQGSGDGTCAGCRTTSTKGGNPVAMKTCRLLARRWERRSSAICFDSSGVNWRLRHGVSLAAKTGG